MQRHAIFPTIALVSASVLVSVSQLAAELPVDSLLPELERSFQQDFIEHWYPRAIDEEGGGYLSGFDAEWQLKGRQDKFLVTQARHLWTSSQAGLLTGDERYRKWSAHGYRFLRDAMWDAEHGGFHSLLARDGALRSEEGKNAYSNAFAIYGLASYHQLTEDESALDLAKQTFRWLDERSWDAEFGGYVDRLMADGSWRGKTESSPADAPWEHAGLKDYNSTIHLLEAFTALYREWPDEQLRGRLEDMLRLTRDRFVGEKGYLQLYFFRDWTPVSLRPMGEEYVLRHLYYDHVSWGHDVETAFLMLEASHVLGDFEYETTLESARRLVDHALDTGWDAEVGALFESGYYFESGKPIRVVKRSREWWVAAEALNAFLLMAKLFPEEPRYATAFKAQWSYIQKHLIDPTHGGWYANGTDEDTEGKRRHKANIWKANYHDGRAYMNCIRMLRGDFELLPQSASGEPGG